ncbi:hypothetical protein TNCV_705841 [Trichonephila clavipes]|nr:hypothetical protein TNCV_705841 [Trichonephila clavipes]
MPIQRDKPSHLGEKTEDMPTQRDKPSHLRRRKTSIPGHGSGEVAFQAEEFIDVPVGSAVFGCREEIRVVHRDANHFRVFAIFWNAGDGQFNRYRLATMVKHVGMGEKD